MELQRKKVAPCIIVNHLIDVSSDTVDPSRNIRFIIIDQLNNTNSLCSNEIDDLLSQKRDFRYQRLSPYMKDLIARMTGIESVVQNALTKGRTYDT